LKKNGSSYELIDGISKVKLYSLEKASFLKKEFIIKDNKGEVFAKCFHKMKTIRKKKIRMYLGNSEHLYSMEGGCFNNKNSDNEVMVQNICGKVIAAITFVDDDNGKATMVSIRDPLTDRPLLVLFAMYALLTAT
jgi:hypothetical protein